MLEFNLIGCHNNYKNKIIDTYKALVEKYPWVPLKKVSIYQQKTPQDRSIGNASEPGHIQLNSYWFNRDPLILQNAAITNIMQTINGQKIAWHGPAFIEPDHVLVHEFGHVMTQALPKWRKWAQPRWEEATNSVYMAPAGYALANADEYFAEAFCMVELGLASEERAEDFNLCLEVNGLRSHRC